MTKFLFIQNIFFELYGVMNLSAILKKNRHECDVLIWSKEKNLIKKIKEIKPDIIAFSISTECSKKALQLANKIKKEMNILILFGGPHPTYFPEVIYEKDVDIICIGEAEETILELANNIQKGKSINNIQNLWVKDKFGKVHKNGLRPLIQDLDKLEFPDRELYYRRYKFLKNLPVKRFITSRGCPWDCSFCYNRSIRKLYQEKGTYLRRRSPDSCIEEILQVKKRYSMKRVKFFDETFTYDKKWLKEFLPKFKRKINLPFSFLARANELDEETVKLLKDNGCKNLFFGIETGNENLRNKILNKKLLNKDIINAANLLKKYKIKFGTYNIFVLPYETLENAFETLALNVKIKQNYPTSTRYIPYPKTKLFDIAVQEKLIQDDFDVNKENILNIKDKNKILNLHHLFYWAVKFPILIPVIKKMIILPPNIFYRAIWKISSMLSSGIPFGINILQLFRLSWEFRNSGILYSWKLRNNRTK